MKAKLKEFFGFFKYSNMKKTVEDLGYSISFYNFFATAVSVIGGSFLLAYLFQLRIEFCIVVVISFMLCIPSMIISKFKYGYEKNRFNDVVNYMEQMIYSFRKRTKIQNALEDVFELSDGNVKSTIKRMLDFIDSGESKNGLYVDALRIMQDEYNCTRIRTLHSFLVEVETHGGKCDKSLSILLRDIRDWSMRTLEYQQERKSLKGKVTISIILAMFTCGIMLNLIPSEYVEMIVGQMLYQVATTFALILCVLLYVYANNKLGGSYLDLEIDGHASQRALRDLDYVRAFNEKEHFKPMVIKLCMMLPLIGVEVYFDFVWGVIPTAIFTVFVLFEPYTRRNNARKRVIREINKVFPVWIRNLVLHLQTDNVQVALRKSLDSCPAILKKEVTLLLVRLDADPTSMTPYLRFLEDYEVSNLKMSVNFLYALSQFGSDDMLSQLDYLIEQNSHLTINEERIRNEDALAGMSMLILAPMLIAVFKLMIDLMLFFNTFMSYISSYGNM